MKTTYKKIISVVPIVFFIGATIFFFASSPEEVILYLGVENAYLLMFVLALIGGLTTFSGVPYPLVLVALASGGLDPLFLGICSATGVMLGDTTSYYLGYTGKEIVPQKVQKILERFYTYCLTRPKLLPFAFFVYGAIVPLSNDFIVISMGLARYPFWRVMIPLGIGNLIFNISLAYLAIYAYGFLQNIFFL